MHRHPVKNHEPEKYQPEGNHSAAKTKKY